MPSSASTTQTTAAKKPTKALAAPQVVSGQAIGTLPTLKTVIPTPAQGYRNGARSFLVGVQRLSNSTNIDEMMCSHILAAFGIECALKSYLSLRGVGKNKIRKLGHDLVHLWSAGKKKGLVSGSVYEGELKILTELTTKDFYARYRHPGNGAVLIASALLTQMVQQIQAETDAAFP
jgi:hypothetical protein